MMDQCENNWMAHHSERHRRKLIWNLHQGIAEVEVYFSPKGTSPPTLLIVTTLQMMILCMFAEKKIVRLASLLNATGVTKEEIFPHLMALVHPDVRVLLKKPFNKALLESDRFQLNSHYSHPQNPREIPLLGRNGPSGDGDLWLCPNPNSARRPLDHSSWPYQWYVRAFNLIKHLKVVPINVFMQKIMSKEKATVDQARAIIVKLLGNEDIRRSDSDPMTLCYNL